MIFKVDFTILFKIIVFWLKLKFSQHSFGLMYRHGWWFADLEMVFLANQYYFVSLDLKIRLIIVAWGTTWKRSGRFRIRWSIFVIKEPLNTAYFIPQHEILDETVLGSNSCARHFIIQLLLFNHLLLNGGEIFVGCARNLINSFL